VAPAPGGLGAVLEPGSPAELAEARREAERAVSIREALHGPDHPEVAGALEALAQVLWLSGDYAAEARAAERALRIRESGPPGGEALVAKNLHFLSEARRAEGDLGSALLLRERIGPILDRLHGPDHPERAVHLHALATIKDAIGDAGGAVAAAAAAAAIWERASDPRLASGLNHLAHLHLKAGDGARAEPLLRRALALWESSVGPAHPDVARALSNLAAILSERGDHAGAGALARRALSIRERAFGPEHLLVARSLAALGAVEGRLGRAGEARALLRRAVSIQERSAVASRWELAASLRELAFLEWGRGDAAAALDLALRAEGISRDHFLLTSGGLSEREALLKAGERAGGMALALSAAEALAEGGALPGDRAARVLDALIRSRALVLDVTAARRRVVALDPSARTEALVDALRRARSRLARIAVQAGGAASPDAALHELRRARAEADRAERELALRSREFGIETARERAGLMEVAPALPAPSALVAYVRHEGAAGAPSPGAAARYAALVLRAGAAAPALVPLGSAAEVDRAVAAWRREVSADPRLPRAADAGTAYLRSARRLAALIWDPVARLLEGVDLALVVPDGALHQVGLASLVGPGGGYLVESGPAVHYLAAERDLAAAGRPQEPGRGLLAVGDPDFDAAPEGVTSPPGGRTGPARGAAFRLEPLPGSRREAAEAAARWDPREGTVLLTGAGAGEAAFKRLAPSRRVLHLGTHALLGPAGLAFAGANLIGATAADGASEDGILTAEEIALLDLGSVEWAVLSGCATGTGETQAGEGILGLRRAFQVAGARTLIMSLWPVEDEAARHWMSELYEARASGAPTYEAVRRAGRALLDAQRRAGRSTHPHHWGSFVAAGEWR
jgi:CHAT domain-containing protein